MLTCCAYSCGRQSCPISCSPIGSTWGRIGPILGRCWADRVDIGRDRADIGPISNRYWADRTTDETNFMILFN